MAFASANIAYGDFSLPRTAAGDATTGGVSGVNKLWLPLWSGEVLNAYDQYNIFEHLITYRPLMGGFSYEFPVTGTVSLLPSWDAGVELGGASGGTPSATTTFKVNLDKRPMAAHFETDNIDALITQWDYRSELARQAGLTLASNRDKQIISSLIAACVVPSLVNDPRAVTGSTIFMPEPSVVNGVAFGGGAVATTISAGVTVAGVLPNAATEQVGLNILASIENYLVEMQQNDYPVGMVVCAVNPKVFQVIRALGIPRSQNDLGTRIPMFGASDMYGGNGVPMAYGANALTDSLDYMSVKIVKTNHFPKTQLSIGSSKYNLNCSLFDIYGLIFQPECVAGLALQGLKVDSVQDIRRNTQFTVASMLMGTGVLRPELCKLLVGPLGAASAISADTTTNTRAKLFAFLDTTSTNLTSGFASEYKVTGS